MTTYIGGIQASAVAAWQALSEALDEVNDRVPCKESPDIWYFEAPTPESIAYAENHCRNCPVLAYCGAYADAAKETGAVWGGRYRPTRVGRPAKPINQDGLPL